MSLDFNKISHDVVVKLIVGAIAFVALGVWGMFAGWWPGIWTYVSQTSWLPGWALLLLGLGMLALGFWRGADWQSKRTSKGGQAMPAAAIVPPIEEKPHPWKRHFEAMDQAERFVLRQFIDAGQDSMEQEAFIARAKRCPGMSDFSGQEVSDAMDRLETRNFLWTSGNFGNHTMGLTVPHFSTLSEFPEWVGSTAPKRIVA